VENTLLESEVEIGSGVCVDPTGLVLTAGHVAPEVGCFRVVAFSDGVTFWGEAIAVSEEYDLALLKLHTHDMAWVKKKKKTKKKTKTKRKRTKRATFPFAELNDGPPVVKDKLLCVGQPGRPRGERLELTSGKVEAVIKDPLSRQDNVDTDGGLVHSCPTFAGNSGSALLLARNGRLVGIHTGYNCMKEKGGYKVFLTHHLFCTPKVCIHGMHVHS
jgi:S1-C subfamily serine protease